MVFAALCFQEEQFFYAMVMSCGRFFLIGYSGCGKSRCAKIISERLGITFVDSDSVIENLLGMSISEIFDSKGEAFFRQVEREVLLDYCNNYTYFIMATGGGMPCFFDNISLMNKYGTTFFIQKDVKILSRQLSKTFKPRPRFKGLSLEQLEAKVSDDLNVRTPFYLQADYVIDGNTDYERLIVDLISSCLCQSK